MRDAATHTAGNAAILSSYHKFLVGIAPLCFEACRRRQVVYVNADSLRAHDSGPRAATRGSNRATPLRQ